MTMFKISPLLTAVIVAASSAQLYAEDTDSKSLWSGEAEFGYVATSGNTEETLEAYTQAKSLTEHIVVITAGALVVFILSLLEFIPNMVRRLRMSLVYPMLSLSLRIHC